MFFITFHGTFLCLDGSRIVQREPREIGDLAELLDIDLGRDPDEDRFTDVITNTAAPQTTVIRSGPLAGFVLHIVAGGRMAGISDSGSFLCAVPGKTVLEANRSKMDGWESFACVSRQDVADLLHILANDWVVGSSVAIVPRSDVRLDANFRLRIGQLEVDIRYNLPFLETTRDNAPGRHATGDVGASDSALLAACLLIEGWRVERIFLYRPMIFLTAFKAPQYIEQATMCITSLLEFGRYQGHIHLISDRPREEFLAAIPALNPERFSVQAIAASDWVGYVAAKYCVIDFVPAHAHQPLLFLDPDTLADNDLAPMLAAVAMSPRILAPMEDFSHLAHHLSVGASLIQRAGGAPRTARGFNGGTIGIPNLRTHGVFLKLIRTIIANHIELHGRDEFQWVDQEVANYVSFAVGGFDTTTLVRYVRFGWEGSERNAVQRIGLVHFWPARISKNEAMRIYLETLRSADAALETLRPVQALPAG